MKVSTDRVKELAEKGGFYESDPVFVERRRLAADLLEARKLLRRIAREFGGSKSVEAKRVRLRVRAYFVEEV